MLYRVHSKDFGLIGQSLDHTGGHGGVFRTNDQWSTNHLEDGRIVVFFPSLDLARMVEQTREIRLSGFTLSFTPWMADLDSPEKADEELRWVTSMTSPFSVRTGDIVERLLKPVEDLI
ncbi:hypothetical protein J5N97_024523 [Dioscorea zingiberensis]|uniref:Uncharacterized protein n=1 Tax=Dioscorea zingiberensis TaxID=325984 RepID=A0A9D5H8T0_9LILI|nr:hypothetical protein J5N97_024523 [Dioscorea zingiberensis]